MSRCLGIDFGTKRIGLALGDPTGLLASPLETLDGTAPRRAAARIADLCREYDVDQLVIGWPLNMDGSEGAMTEAVEAFVQRLESSLSLPVFRRDERLTSESAQEVLQASGMRRDKRKKVIDQLAAVLILQDYLDEQSPPEPPPPYDPTL